MTTMIYRGARHDGLRSVQPRRAQELIYRGVAHDGLTPARAARRGLTEMCYRGVRYTIDAKGAIAGIVSSDASQASSAAATPLAWTPVA